MNYSGVRILTGKNASKITPEVAGRMLEHNTNNRRPSKTHIDRIARMLKKGDWRVTGDAIVFNRKGELVNGQKRLMACVSTGIPIYAFVITGLNNDVYQYTDDQQARTLADRMRVLKNTAEIVNQYCTHVLGANTKITASEGDQVYQSLLEHFDYASAMRPKRKGLGIAAIWAALVMYHSVDKNKAAAFASDFVTVSELHQCNVLKNWLLEKAKYVGGQMQKEILMRSLYCMDAHYHGIDIKRIGRLAPQDAFKDAI
jgi:hypothetical protein